jgi:hypothetical protein
VALRLRLLSVERIALDVHCTWAKRGGHGERCSCKRGQTAALATTFVFTMPHRN